MPTTPNGTVYTVYSATVTDAGTVKWGVADAAAGTANIPAILYCHGSGGASNQFETLSAWTGLRNWLMDNGFAWIEGTGGGTKSWGNEAARIAYDTSYAHVAGVLDLGPVIPLGRSMGGVVAQYLFTQSPVVAPACVGAIINSGVQSLAAWYEAGIDQPAVLSAYGATDSASFYAAIEGYEPLDFPATAWAGKKIIQLVGDSDTTVPAEDHGLAMRAHYAGQPSLDLLDIRAGGDHSATNGSYLEVDDMVAFISQAMGWVAPEPETLYFYRSRARYYIGDDLRRYALAMPNA
jgi:pimeloyl-ACP methyl ester carboxylesterase